MNLYDDKIVGSEVHETNDTEHAVSRLRRTARAEALNTLDYKPVLHGDTVSILKATTILAMMKWIGLSAFYSRSRVSDDIFFVETLFRTATSRPQFPVNGFADRDWASLFVRWYNHDHRDGGIRDVSPAQQRGGEHGAAHADRYGDDSLALRPGLPGAQAGVLPLS